MSQHNAEHRLFINGAPVDAEGGATYDVINPATEEVVGVVAAASTADGASDARHGGDGLAARHHVPRVERDRRPGAGPRCGRACGA